MTQFKDNLLGYQRSLVSICFILSTKKEQQAEYYTKRLMYETDRAKSSGMYLQMHIAVTGENISASESIKDFDHTEDRAHKETISEIVVSDSSSSLSWQESCISQEVSVLVICRY